MAQLFSTASKTPVFAGSGVPSFYGAPRPALRGQRKRSAETSAGAAPIALEDHTEDDSETRSELWAENVTVDDYVVVGSSDVGGSYIVWMCNVGLRDGGRMKIRKRYSEFDELRLRLLHAFPHMRSVMPPLPRKSVVSKFSPSFLEKRRAGLAYFLNCVLLNPEFAGSPVLKDFLFSSTGEASP